MLPSRALLSQYFHLLLIFTCASIVAICVFSLLPSYHYFDIATVSPAGDPTVPILDMYDSQEWHTLSRGVVECDLRQFDKFRKRELAQFYGPEGVEGAAKYNSDWFNGDQILLFVSGCIQCPLNKSYEPITLKLVQHHAAGSFFSDCSAENQILSTKLLRSSGNTTTLAFLISAIVVKRKCRWLHFFTDWHPSHIEFHLNIGHSCARHDSKRRWHRINLPTIEWAKLGNRMVELVAREPIELTDQQQAQDQEQQFHHFRGLPVVLAWNKQFFYPYQWDFWPSTLTYGQLPNDNCPFKCIYTTDRQAESSASVLLFHVFWSNPIGFWPFWRWPLRHSPDQLFAFFTLESPYYAGRAFHGLAPGWFNVSITYRSDSTVPYPYDALEEITVDTPPGDVWTEEEIKERIAKKSGLALQIVSKCGTSSGRDQLTAELSRLMQVDQFGACSGRDCDQACYEREMGSHFFYLAFENSVCPQYVTEKFWNALRHLTVPVVLRRRTLHGVRVPAGAFIAADDFCSARELAAHLQKLQADSQQYAQHFNWTQTYSKKTRRDSLSPICQLCKMAHEYPRKSRMIDTKEFWSNDQCKYDFVGRELFHEDSICQDLYAKNG